MPCAVPRIVGNAGDGALKPPGCGTSCTNNPTLFTSFSFQTTPHTPCAMRGSFIPWPDHRNFATGAARAFLTHILHAHTPVAVRRGGKGKESDGVREGSVLFGT